MKHLLTLFVLLFTLTACHNDTDEPEPANKQAHRTVLVYMVAQNSLGGERWHRADSAEIMYGRQYIPNNDRMLVYVDDAQAPRLYRIARQWDKPQLIKQWSRDVCSTSPQQFAEVVEMAKNDFPSNELALVMWSHADGWLPATNKNYAHFESAPTDPVQTPASYGIDSGPQGGMSDKGAQMDVTDLAAALQRANVHCKYILFDCCLMQNLEVDYALRHVTKHIFSPFSIHECGVEVAIETLGRIFIVHGLWNKHAYSQIIVGLHKLIVRMCKPMCKVFILTMALPFRVYALTAYNP